MRTLSLLLIIGLCHGNFFPDTLLWEGGAFLFPSDSLESLYRETGEYIPKNMMAIKAVNKFDRLILLTPRCKPGVPASLVIHDPRNQKLGAMFSAFPSLEDHEKGNCKAIQNAVDMYLDDLGLLWVLDSGIINNVELPEPLCPPKVVCISLISKRIIETVDLSLLTEKNSRLQNIIADNENNGRTHLYIGDAVNRQVLVYNVGNRMSYKITLPSDVAPVISPQDVMYMAITRQPTEQAVLYITYLNGPKLISIDTKYLKTGDVNGEIKDVGLKKELMMFLGTNRYSKLFFRYEDSPDIYVWDTTKPFDAESLTPIYTSEDCFEPISVMVDRLRCFKVLESMISDYYDEDKTFGSTQQIVDLTKENEC